MIEIVPDVLEYKPPFTKSSTEYVTITNKGSEAIAFKVKTTAPKIYCVRPNAAVVEPGQQVQIHVILLGLSEEPSAEFKCKDKFLLITLPAPYNLGETSVAEAWPQLEAQFKEQAVSKKIKVKYLLGGGDRQVTDEVNGGVNGGAVSTKAARSQEQQDQGAIQSNNKSSDAASSRGNDISVGGNANDKFLSSNEGSKRHDANGIDTGVTADASLNSHAGNRADPSGASAAVSSGASGRVSFSEKRELNGNSNGGANANAPTRAGTTGTNTEEKQSVSSVQESAPIFNPALVLLVALLALVLGWLYY